MFSLQYIYMPAKWLGFGAMMGYQHFSKKYELDENGDDITAMVIFFLMVQGLRSSFLLLGLPSAMGKIILDWRK